MTSAVVCHCESCNHEWTATEGDPCPVCRIADAPENASNPVGLGLKIIALAVLLAIVVAS